MKKGWWPNLKTCPNYKCSNDDDDNNNDNNDNDDNNDDNNNNNNNDNNNSSESHLKVRAFSSVTNSN